MKRRTVAIALAAALALAGAAGLAASVLGSGRGASSAPPSAEVERPSATGARSAVPAAARSRPRTVVAPVEGGAGSGAGAEAISVGRDDTVATVNGVAITGADLIAFRAAEGDRQEMSPEMYEFLRQRALERELTFQAARARGIELNAADTARLAVVRENAAQRGETDPAQLAFEVGEARAQLLLGDLLAADGVPPPLAGDADVDRYLADHAAEYGSAPPDPAAAQQRRVEVRQQLYGEFAASYQDRVRELLARLEAAAQITP